MSDKKKFRNVNGYILVYCPDHPSSYDGGNWDGYIYEHTLVAEEVLGRSLKNDEVVHHLNGDRGDNRPGNLLVLNDRQHHKIHKWIENGAPGLQDSGLNEVNSEESKLSYCLECPTPLVRGQSNYCSRECSASDRTKIDWPNKETLGEMIEEKPMVQVGEELGVSDNAVRKRARKLGII